MTYDDSKRALARGAAVSFKCLLCGRPMRDVGKQWECRCGFFYKPVIPGTIPKKYQHGAMVAAKKLCRDCRRTEVRGIQRYCADCTRRRKRASNRKHWQKRSSLGKTGFRHIGAEALTNVL
jgi:hypothetical protein